VPGDDGGTQSASPPTASSTSAPTTPEGPVPSSPDDLINRFKRVLGDTATFTVKDTAGNGPGTATVPPDPTGETAGQPLPGSTITSEVNVHTLPGAFINGTLTTKAGAKGGFDLQIYAGDPGVMVTCSEEADDCATTTLPDGSTLSIWVMRLQDPGGITYEANLARPDGTTLIMHVSNQADPKGAGEIYGPQPPFTTDELKAIITSDRW